MTNFVRFFLEHPVLLVGLLVLVLLLLILILRIAKKCNLWFRFTPIFLILIESSTHSSSRPERVLRIFIVVADLCKPSFIALANTNVLDGAVNNAPTVEVCQAVCARNTSCTGIDWNPTQPAGQKCWMSGPWSGNIIEGRAHRITHYVILRPADNCPGL